MEVKDLISMGGFSLNLDLQAIIPQYGDEDVQECEFIICLCSYSEFDSWGMYNSGSKVVNNLAFLQDDKSGLDIIN